MDKNVIKISLFSKILFCMFDFLVPIASIYSLILVSNFITGNSFPRGFILPLLLLILTISLLSFIQRKNECRQCLVLEENVLHTCIKTKNNLKIINSTPIEKDAKFVPKGIKGIFLIQNNQQSKILNYNPSMFMFIWSCLFVANFAALFLILKSSIETVEISVKLNEYYNPNFVNIIQKTHPALKIFINIFCVVLMLFILAFSFLTCVYLFDKVSVYF